MRKRIPVARRVLGESRDLALKMRLMYAVALYDDTSATLDDLHEAVTTLEETERTVRRVFGGTHPLAEATKTHLRNARDVLGQRGG